MTLCLGIVLSTPGAQADAWGANQTAAIWTYVVNKIERHIEGVLLGSLKMTAMNLLNSQIGQLIGGGGLSGSPRFITNWQDELFLAPQRNAQLYMNDFFTLSTRGMASSANYVGRSSSSGISDWSFSSSKLTDSSRGGHLNNPLAMNDPLTLRAEGMTSSGGIGAGSGGNYARYLERIGRAAISGDSQRTMTLQEFTSSPQEMFRTGDWRAFDSFVSNPMNNPYGYSLAAEQAYQAKLEIEKEVARTQAIAYQGFKGTEAIGGIVTTPGSTIKSFMDNVNDFPNKIIAGATNPAELVGNFASAAASKVINGLVNYGVNQVEQAVLKPLAAIDRQVTDSINQVNGIVGPAAGFMTQAEREAAVLAGSIPSSGWSTTSSGGNADLCAGQSAGSPCGTSGGRCTASSDLGSGLWCIIDERECTNYSDTGRSCLGGRGTCRDGQCVANGGSSGRGLNERCDAGNPCGTGLYCNNLQENFYYQQCRPVSEQAGADASGRKPVGAACESRSECASGYCSDICTLPCADEEIFDYNTLQCRLP